MFALGGCVQNKKECVIWPGEGLKGYILMGPESNLTVNESKVRCIHVWEISAHLVCGGCPEERTESNPNSTPFGFLL